MRVSFYTNYIVTFQMILWHHWRSVRYGDTVLWLKRYRVRTIWTVWSPLIIVNKRTLKLITSPSLFLPQRYNTTPSISVSVDVKFMYSVLRNVTKVRDWSWFLMSGDHRSYRSTLDFSVRRYNTDYDIRSNMIEGSMTKKKNDLESEWITDSCNPEL